MITKEDFTKSETIDEFQQGDSTIDLVGYVITSDSNSHTTAKSKFKKIVCCNGVDRNVQVIAWNELTSKLDNIELGTIVHCSCLKFNIPRKEFNKGNVVFELMIQSDSEITKYESFSDNEAGIVLEEVPLLEACAKIGQRIKVQGVIKTEPAIYENLKYSVTVASITNMFELLEMKFRFTPDKLTKPLLKGISVMVIGTMEQHIPGPPTLRVDHPEDIEIMDIERVSFSEILNGFRTH